MHGNSNIKVNKQSTIDEWMGMDYSWNETLSGMPKSSLKNPFPFHFVHQKHEQAWNRTLAPWWEAGDYTLELAEFNILCWQAFPPIFIYLLMFV